MIFNKNEQGSEELYRLSGTFQAATDFHAIEAEIESATQEVASIVGSGIVEKAQEIYDDASRSDEEENFLLAVQRPVAYLAISRYARLTGLSHGDTGRKIKADDNEKIPFEWMIDRDDREMRERYFRALDTLFSLLESSAEVESWSEAWESSDIRTLISALIVKKLGDVERVYPLEHSRYMFYLLSPIMLEVQQTKLRDIVGDERLQKLVDGDESVQNIRNQAIRYTVLRAMVTAVQRWSVEVFPLAVARRFHPSYQGNKDSRLASTAEMEWFIDKLELQIKDAALELQTAIAGNPYEGMDLVPENSPRNKYFTV